METFDIDRVTGFGFGKEGLVGASFVFVNDFLGSVKDVLSGAVVLFEFDNFGTWEIFFEIKNVGKIGATPGINGLPIVADDADVALFVD